MSIESFDNVPQESTEGQPPINIEDYEGKIIIENGEYRLLKDGTKLTEKNGELYVSEGEYDAGTRLIKNNEPIIRSGF